MKFKTGSGHTEDDLRGLVTYLADVALTAGTPFVAAVLARVTVNGHSLTRRQHYKVVVCTNRMVKAYIEYVERITRSSEGD